MNGMEADRLKFRGEWNQSDSVYGSAGVASGRSQEVLLAVREAVC
jgi:hypothetical protein